MQRRNFARTFVFLMSILGGACSKSSPPTSSAPPEASAASLPAPSAAPAAPSAITLRVGHDLWVGYSGVFLAKELGYFKEAGIELELKPFSNPGDTLPALVSDQLDVGLTTLQNLAVLNGNGESDVVAIAVVDSSNGADAVVARKSIKTFAELKDKKVALTLGEVNHFLFLVGAKRAGLAANAIKLTSMSADDAGAAFVAGKVDAAVTWEPWVTKATKSGGHVIFTSADVPDTIMDSVAVRRSKLQGKASTYKAFLSAIDKGVTYLKSEPDKAAALIGKYLNAPADDVKGMLAGDQIYGLADNQKLFGTASAQGPVYQSMKSVIEFALESKLIKKAPDAEKLFEPSLVR